MAFLWRDEKSVILQKTNSSTSQFTVPLNPTRRVRAIKHLYPEGCHDLSIPQIEIGKKQSSYYIHSPESITIKSAREGNKFVLVYYQTPELSPVPKSWIMDMYPMQVIDAALLNLYLDQRDTSQADRYRVIVGRAREDRGTHMYNIWTDQLQQNAPL
jgi:hypothetical protein